MDLIKKIKQLHYYWNINFHKWWKDMEIWIRIIKVCNEKCIFCSTDLDNKIIDYKELLLIISFLINYYKDKYNLFFSFTWWEPTIYPNLDKIILYVIKKWFYAKIETNAVNFSNELYIEKYKKFKWKLSFFVSFHWHTNKLYNLITNTDFYDKSVVWIKKLCSFFWNNYVEINCVINDLNIKSLKQYLDFVDNNFYYNDKIKLTFSMMLANKKEYDKYLVNYTEIINFLNKVKEFNLKYIDLILDAWWYCQLPFCLFEKINFIDKKEILKYASKLDKNVWIKVMQKSNKCKDCIYWEYCLWLSDWYFNKYWDIELICIK